MKKMALIPVVLCLVVMIAGCKKNKQYDLGPDLNAADDIVISESSYNHIFENLLIALADPALKTVFHSVIDSASVTSDTVSDEYIFIYNSKMCADSVIRYGRIEIYWYGNMPDIGTVFNIYFQNYFEFQSLVTGRDSVVYRGTDGKGNMVFDNYIISGVIHKGEQVIQWNSTNTFYVDPALFQAGNNLNYYIRGSANGVSSKGFSFTAGINDSLVHQDSCPWILSGTIGFHIPGADVENGTIDFITGDGCTNRLKYDFEGNVYYLWNNRSSLAN